MQNTNDIEKRLNHKRIVELFTPSWLSGFIAVVAGLVVTLGVFVLFGIQSSHIQQQLLTLQSTAAPATLTLPGQTPPDAGTSSSLLNTWPLLAFWGVVGLMVYFIVETIAKGLANVAELKNELNFVHARRDGLIRTTVEYLAIRVVGAVLWLVFIDIFFKRIIPYSITAAYASASNPRSLDGFLFALLSFIMIALSMHLHAIFLRLSLRRPRVFSKADYL
jgi:hypothetical protein